MAIEPISSVMTFQAQGNVVQKPQAPAQAEKPEEESAAEGEKPKRKRAPRRKKAEESPEETAEGSAE